MFSVSPARKAAFDILLEIERSRAHSDDLLRGARIERLAVLDRNLATALVLGVLRWQIWLDQRVGQFLDRPKARLDLEIRLALRLGAFQLLQMDRIPAHAAIDESVELARQAGHRFASRMVNAVLRKLASVPRLSNDEMGSAAAQAYPEWMTERWRRFYGPEAAQAICAHGLRQPATAIRVGDPAIEEELNKTGIELEPGKLLAAARIVTAGDVIATEAFRAGHVRLQDEGSQLVGEMAGRGDAILDCCAAPGGKTLILAERNPKAHIVACETNPHRLGQLQKRLAPLGERIVCRPGDAAALDEENAYDLVLADVPCSGTGTLGRNPEIRHRLGVEDLPRQAERQCAILRAALRAAKQSGRVIYSTCSMEPEENEEVVAALVGDDSSLRVIPIQERIEQLERHGIVTLAGAEKLQGSVTPEGYLRLLPGALGTDGFFIAVIKKLVFGRHVAV
jgi:16S rRNA (cytosine967-C5)-methyltransferase